MEFHGWWTPVAAGALQPVGDVLRYERFKGPVEVRFLAINAAISYLKSHFANELSIEKRIICEFAILNPECLGEECRYYGH